MKTKDFFKLFFFTVIAALFAVGCSDNDDPISFRDYAVKVNLPEDLAGVNPSGLKVILTNLDTNVKTTLSTDANGYVNFVSIPGVYNIEVSGTKTYSFVFSTDANGKDSIVTNTVDLVGLRTNVPLLTGTSETIDAFIQIASKGWVIKEMYTAATRDSAGKIYTKDQFIEIYNNTDSIMYADGISIGETRYTTTANDLNFYGSDINKNVYVYTVYTIPGNGTTYPVQPGKSIVIAPQPIDHAPTSINLASPISDFQWYDAHATLSVQVPEVPDLTRYYSYTATVWIVTVQMNRAFIIFKVPEDMDMDAFVANNTDKRPNNAGNDVTSIAIPNTYVLDAVELSELNGFKDKSIASSLDIGFSYRTSSYNGKSIRRKIERVEEDGRIVYKDTNNSTLDFWVSKTPSPKQFPTDDEKDN